MKRHEKCKHALVFVTTASIGVEEIGGSEEGCFQNVSVDSLSHSEADHNVPSTQSLFEAHLNQVYVCTFSCHLCDIDRKAEAHLVGHLP